MREDRRASARGGVVSSSGVSCLINAATLTTSNLKSHFCFSSLPLCVSLPLSVSIHLHPLLSHCLSLIKNSRLLTECHGDCHSVTITTIHSCSLIIKSMHLWFITAFIMAAQLLFSFHVNVSSLWGHFMSVHSLWELLFKISNLSSLLLPLLTLSLLSLLLLSYFTPLTPPFVCGSALSISGRGGENESLAGGSPSSPRTCGRSHASVPYRMYYLLLLKLPTKMLVP